MADAQMCRRQYLTFSNGDSGYLGEQKRLFDKILSKFRGETFLEDHQTEMKRVSQWLDDADCVWKATIEQAQFPFSTESVSRVVEKISLIVDDLENVYTVIRTIRSQLVQQES